MENEQVNRTSIPLSHKSIKTKNGITNLNTKAKFIQLLEENTGENL